MILNSIEYLIMFFVLFLKFLYYRKWSSEGLLFDEKNFLLYL